MLRIVYIALSVGSIGLLVVDAPSGGLLTTTPDRGKVELSKDKDGKTTTTGRTVRSGPAFIWLGGGYQGGK
jgi:hypothetical protein